MKTSNNSKNYKVRCTGFNCAERFFTKGKVYEVKNNCITNDDGYTYREFWDWGKGGPSKPMDYLKKWYNFEVVEYKVGDHVIIEESNIEFYEKFAGKSGVIVDVNDKFEHPYSVIPDDKKDMWTNGFGVWCHVKGYAPEEKEVKEEKIVITHDGKTTTATMYKGDMKHVGTARCCPEDTFDFNYGAKLAMERLMKEVAKWDKPSEEEESDWRVVNRLVKKGDYIRLKRKWFTFNEKGDVLKVSDVMRNFARVRDEDHPRDTEMEQLPDYLWNYPSDYYEVVEKVEEPKFTKYEEGQFVRVVQKHTHHFPLGQIVKVVEHKTGFFDEEGIIMCEGFCENVNMISIQCVLPEEIAPLD